MTILLFIFPKANIFHTFGRPFCVSFPDPDLPLPCPRLTYLPLPDLPLPLCFIPAYLGQTRSSLASAHHSGRGRGLFVLAIRPRTNLFNYSVCLSWLTIAISQADALLWTRKTPIAPRVKRRANQNELWSRTRELIGWQGVTWRAVGLNGSLTGKRSSGWHATYRLRIARSKTWAIFPLSKSPIIPEALHSFLLKRHELWYHLAT